MHCLITYDDAEGLLLVFIQDTALCIRAVKALASLPHKYAKDHGFIPEDFSK